MILKVIIFYTYLLKIKNACHKNQRKKSRIIIQKKCVLWFSMLLLQRHAS